MRRHIGTRHWVYCSVREISGEILDYRDREAVRLAEDACETCRWLWEERRSHTGERLDIEKTRVDRYGFGRMG